MAVDASAVTQLDEDVVPLHSLAAGRVVSSHDGERTTSSVASRTSQAITVYTKEGYYLSCTKNQQLRTPTEWVAARESTELLVRGYHTRTSGDPHRDHPLACSDAAIAAALGSASRTEHSAGLDLIVDYVDERRAEWAQWCLLAPSVFSVRTSRRLYVRQPGAAWYAEHVGCIRPSLTNHLLMGSRLEWPLLSEAAQRHAHELVSGLGVERLMSHPAQLNELQELTCLLINNEMHTNECARTIELLQEIPPGDLLIRNMLVKHLRSQLSQSHVVHVKKIERCSRLNLVDVHGSNYLANGFTCREARS